MKEYYVNVDINQSVSVHYLDEHAIVVHHTAINIHPILHCATSIQEHIWNISIAVPSVHSIIVYKHMFVHI